MKRSRRRRKPNASLSAPSSSSLAISIALNSWSSAMANLRLSWSTANIRRLVCSILSWPQNCKIIRWKQAIEGEGGDEDASMAVTVEDQEDSEEEEARIHPHKHRIWVRRWQHWRLWCSSSRDQQEEWPIWERQMWWLRSWQVGAHAVISQGE